ncbi:MAG: VanW family protein [Lachnospiraceae bacterium]|nr:VanW family protein [Lachnospiraceae bacterium]
MRNKQKLMGIFTAMAKVVIPVTAVAIALLIPLSADAAPGSGIEAGVFVDDIDISGCSTEEAAKLVRSRVAEWDASTITVTDGADYSYTFTGTDIGFKWVNTSVIDEAAALGKSGDIVSRYMQLTDLTRQPKVYELEYAVDNTLLSGIISGCAAEYDREAVNASLTRADGSFSITDGVAGRAIDQAAVVSGITDHLIHDWDGSPFTYNMEVETLAPLGSYEDLSRVTDVLGTFTTSYSTSGSSRSANIANACGLINGTTLYPGEEFSTLDTITPFSEANGYFMAGSYLNGQVVDSLGGGICQVSTTLYNAVLLSELEVSERHCHSMIIGYVKPSMDAAIAESSGKNFRFINNTDYPIYIDGHTNAEKQITFTIYGVESRPSSHKVTYESEVLETTVPESDAVYTTSAQGAGYSSGIQSAHIGYKARLWRNTYENGELVSRDEVNSSKYNMSPRSITIGIATDNADIYNMLMEAAASGSADTAAAAAAQAAAMLNPAPAEGEGQ